MKEQKNVTRRIRPVRDLSYVIARLFKRMRLSAIRRSSIHPTSKIEAGSQVVDSSFDRHSYCGYNCVFIKAQVGAFCSISDDVIVGGSGHPMHFVSTSPVFLSHRDSVKAKFSKFDYLDIPKTTIGSDVWIGRGVLVRSGVTIGHGAVVGMGSVVTRDVAPYTIVGGNPAQVIRPRFDKRVASRLLASKWWALPEDELKHWAKWFNDPEMFLSEWEKQ